MGQTLTRKPKNGVQERTSWMIVPQCGRLMPLALDATMYSVATSGLSQRQIDATPLEMPVSGFSFRKLVQRARALLYQLKS